MFNTTFFHIVVAFLGTVSHQLKQQTIADLNNKSLMLSPETLYVKKEITGGGIINLIDANTLNLPGISNFDKNTLQSGRIFVFDQIAIQYKSDTGSGKEGSLQYNAAAPAELQNAIFRISQNGKKVIELPVVDLHNLAAGNNRADQYTSLKALGLLVDDKTIEMQLIFPAGVALSGATKHYVSISLSGLQTVSKA
jgi:hypothetical protein